MLIRATHCDLSRWSHLLLDMEDARQRFRRFAPILATLFPDGRLERADARFDGTLQSPLLPFRKDGDAPIYVKADHLLPISGSVKSRGGIYEVLVIIEMLAIRHGLIIDGDLSPLLGKEARRCLERFRLVVGSTGNLGLSVGMVARAFGMDVEVHMSSDAKRWKKDKLRDAGATVVSHRGDYGTAVNNARAIAASDQATFFVDDENSLDLFVGYAVAARELADQLADEGIAISDDCPLHVYIPCGVGGAPGGITFGLKSMFGTSVRAIFVEPVESACFRLALSAGHPVRVDEFGLTNRTIADGLAVARASPLVFSIVKECIDAVVTVADADLLGWMARAFSSAGLRLEPSAAAALAAIAPYAGHDGASTRAGVHVAWTTGGGLLPDDEFAALLAQGAAADADARTADLCH